MSLKTKNMDHQESKRTKTLLGQVLIKNQLITRGQLEVALQEQVKTGQLLGKTLYDLDYISEESDFTAILADQLGVQHIKLKDLTISPEVLALIPAQFITHYKVIPIKLQDGIVTIATSHPTNIHMFDEINLSVTHPLKPVLASDNDIDEAIRNYYGLGAATIEQMMDKTELSDAEDDIDDIEDIGSEASISKFFNQILLEAYKDGANGYSY